MSKTSTFDPSFFEHVLSRNETLIVPGKTVIVGFSGGPDSMLLLHFFVWLQKQYDLTVMAAHVDHEWREKSGQDALFCQKIAAELQVPFVLGKGSEIPLEKSSYGSLEEEGRRKRRTFFEQVAAGYSNACIALGHHQDDQHETFFLRLMRGAGVAGLAGMSAQDGIYIRPLLPFTKQDIVKWLTDHSVAFLTDETNQSEAFLRNRIRLNVIPALRACDSRFDESLTRTMNNLRETEDFLVAHVQQELATCTQQHPRKRCLNLELFFKHHPFLQKQILLHWLIEHDTSFVPSARFFDEILRFLKNNKSQKHAVHQSWSLIKKDRWVYIEKN